MILEHTFVTTFDDAKVIQQIDAIFVAMRFMREPGEPLHRQYHNGRSNPRTARKISDLPIRVWVNCDRGRISLAASIEESPRYRKQRNLLRDELFAIADACERLLKDAEPPDSALARWSELDRRFEQLDRQRKRRERMLLIGILAFVFIVIAGLVILARME